MGYGDAKLLAMIGGLGGWQVLLPVIFLSALQGSVIGITLMAVARGLRRRRGEEEPVHELDEEEPPADPHSLWQARLPYGPFLCLAAVEVILLRAQLPMFFPYLYQS